MRIFNSVFSAAALAIIAFPVGSEPIRFDKNWVEQGFFRLWSNDYDLKGDALDVGSDGTVSLLYRRAPASIGNATKAAWNWAVSESVTATDLTKKGGDDRNLALYFVFVDPLSADKLAKAPARKLLTNPNTRALVYVWGGDYKRGQVLFSPYGPKTLKTVAQRAAGKGSFSESVDLDRDFQRAFKQEKGVLVGLGITADSDDTDGKIKAMISNLVVE
jgi:hypothetical protein